MKETQLKQVELVLKTENFSSVSHSPRGWFEDLNYVTISLHFIILFNFFQTTFLPIGFLFVVPGRAPMLHINISMASTKRNSVSNSSSQSSRFESSRLTCITDSPLNQILGPGNKEGAQVSSCTHTEAATTPG